MGIRETMNRHSKLVAIATVAICGAITWVMIASTWDRGGPGRQFYTDDDGKTWYTDRADLIVPFERNGKTVVMAEVFEVNGKQSVLYMRRYPEQVAARLRSQGRDAIATTRTSAEAQPPRMEYKKPGDTQWRDFGGNSAAMGKYIDFSSPDGTMSQVEP